MVQGLLLVSLVPLAAAILWRVRLAASDAVTVMMVFDGLHGHLLGTETAHAVVVWVGLGVMTSAVLPLGMGASAVLVSVSLD